MSEKLSADQLQEIRAGAERATDPPWDVAFEHDKIICIGATGRTGAGGLRRGIALIANGGPDDEEPEREQIRLNNSHFIASARANVPALLRHIEALNEENARLAGDSAMIEALLEADADGFLELTAKLEEHPELYDRPCLCRLCQSYGDDGGCDE